MSTMDEQSLSNQAKHTLESFLIAFNKYADEIYGERRRDCLDQLRTQLQQKEPKVTRYLLDILGNLTFTLGSFGQIANVSVSSLLPSALLGGNNELKHNFRDYEAPVTAAINKAIGTIDAGLWPPKEPTPVLVIHDEELRKRCSDLLASPDNYDRVIREATTVLEDRIRNKCPHDTLCRLIPHSADQNGENLTNKLFATDSPVLSISEDKKTRIAFHKILLGVFSYLRNPYHHRLDPNTEWSWAWSTVGFIDRLLSDIDSCEVMQ